MKRLPRSGSTSPAAIFRSVDLPEPLRPTRQARSPGATTSSASSKSRAPPNVSPMFCSVRSGGAMLDDEQRLRNRLAGGRGFEPRPTESELAGLDEHTAP